MTRASSRADFDPQPTAAPCDAVLIVGHGTRDPDGLAEFQSVVDQVARQRPDWHTAGCFLELAEPSIETAVERLAAAGHLRIKAMPLVLFSAGHAKRDIPQALASAVAKNPGVEIELTPPLGYHERIVELSDLRCRQAVAGHAPLAAEETLLILVGRGSSDPETPVQMRELAQRRCRFVSPNGEACFGTVEIALAAVATPALETVLDLAARSSFRRVIVQPHLLFAGSVLSDVQRLVEQRRQDAGGGKTPQRQWIVAERLGPNERVVAAVIDRVSQTAIDAGQGEWTRTKTPSAAL